MGRWVSPRVAALSAMLLLVMLLVQGALSPLRGVRADTASSAPGTFSSPTGGSPTALLIATNPNLEPVNVRAMPTTQSVILVQIAAGDHAIVIETGVTGIDPGTTWVRVSYEGRTGYVRADLVSVMQTVAATRSPIGSATRSTPTAPLLLATSSATPETARVTVVPLSPVASLSPSPAATATGTMPTSTTLTAMITDLTSPVKAGATAMAKVQTVPGAVCAIDVQYLTTTHTTAGLGDITADDTGAVSWTWQVGGQTTPGSWPVVVTCASGGQTALGRMYLEVT